MSTSSATYAQQLIDLVRLLPQLPILILPENKYNELDFSLVGKYKTANSCHFMDLVYLDVIQSEKIKISVGDTELYLIAPDMKWGRPALNVGASAILGLFRLYECDLKGLLQQTLPIYCMVYGRCILVPCKILDDLIAN
jgi:hypothetical protein